MFMASSVWKGHLTFGLVSFPVTLSAAARAETISFNQLHKKDGSRIKEVTYCRAEDAPIPKEEIVKGYEYAKGQYVIIEAEEIKSVAPKTAKVMEVLEFVKAAEVDPLYLESSYYLAPGEGGEKPYALFFEALRQAGYYGVAKIAMHNREHIVILRAGKTGMLLHTMFYEDEIRQTNEFRTDNGLVRPKELDLAKNLIESLAETFEPGKYEDEYRANLKKMIEEKAAGHTVVATPEPQVAPVVDIFEALKQSLAQAKRKPPKTVAVAEAARKPEEETARPQRKRSQRTG
jgi:DNA end-binding protein Ku